MSAVAELRHDHARLRQSLALVEGTLHVGAPAWPILQDACIVLAGQLVQHMVREEPVRRSSAMPDHKEPARQLRMVVRHLVIDKDLLPKDVDTTLYAIMRELGQQMEAQEQRLIPPKGDVQKAEPDASPFATGLTEAATVNRLTRLYPEIGAVFEQLGIDPAVEGCVELEEVAWHRGLETRAFLEQLDQVIRSARAGEAGGAPQRGE